jgi:threonine dehydrogenase-like Zn-dependent dehydrogenase
MTEGRGADSVVDAVGLEAHGAFPAKVAQAVTGLLPDKLAQKLTEKLGVVRLSALHASIKAVRRGGTLCIVGVYGGAADPIPMMDLFDKQVQVRMGQANVKRWVEDIMPLLLDDSDPLGMDDFANHRLSLVEAAHGYDIFQKKQDGAIKVLLRP